MDVAYQPCYDNVHPRGSLKRHTRAVDDAHGARFLDIPVETASTLCSRTDCAARTRSIHVGPAPWSPPALILPSNPESTPPTSTPATLGADFRFSYISGTRGATTPGFQASSPPRLPLRGYQPQEVRAAVPDTENASHRLFSRRTPTSGLCSGSTTSPAPSPSPKTPTRKRSKRGISNRKSPSKGSSTASAAASVRTPRVRHAGRAVGVSGSSTATSAKGAWRHP